MYNEIVDWPSGRKPTFLLASRMSVTNKEEIVAKIAEIAQRVGDPEGIEIVDVQLLGAGRGRVLRIIYRSPPGRLPRRLRIYFAAGRNYFGRGGRHTWRQLYAGGQFAGPGAQVVTDRRILRDLSGKRRGSYCGSRSRTSAAGRANSPVFQMESSLWNRAPAGSFSFPLAQVEKANLKFDW